jgi:hypothetical protein
MELHGRVPVSPECGSLRVLTTQTAAEVHGPEQRIVKMDAAVCQRAAFVSGDLQHAGMMAQVADAQVCVATTFCHTWSSR